MEKIKDLIVRFSRWQYCGLAVLVLVIFIMHLSILYQPNQPLFDELHYVPDARVIMQGDATQRPEHPPLSKLFIIAGMELFGDNPIGWRFFPIVFSLGGVVFFYLICRRLNLSPKVSYIATFLLGLENMSFVHGHIAMLDVYSVFFMILAFWLYLKERYIFSGVAIGLSALAKLTGALAILVIGLHWVLTTDWSRLPSQLRSPFLFVKERRQVWPPLRRFLTAVRVKLWHLLRSLLIIITAPITLLIFPFWLLTRRQPGRFPARLFIAVRTELWHLLRSLTLSLIKPQPRWHFLLLMLAAAITLVALMPILDYGVFHQWTNPIDRIKTMMDISGSITYDWVEPGTGSRPWMWVLVPEAALYWYSPHYNGMISPTLWVFIMPLVLYITYKALRGNTPVLFPLSWFIFSYLVWIPISLITNRVTYLFYFYPTVGAIAMGLAIALSPLLDRAWGRGLIATYLLAHIVAFIIISPVALGWSIPLCLLLYIFTFWLTGLGEGLRFRRRARLAEAPLDEPTEAPVDKPAEAPINEPAEAPVDKPAEP